MSTISWFNCSECCTRWCEFDVSNKEYRPCKGSNCTRSMRPYTTRRKAFGYFQCTSCHRKWLSAHTYSNTFQICYACSTEVLPCTMDPLKFSGELKKGISPHMESLCGICIAFFFIYVYIFLKDNPT